ncbi:hypothetical protein GWI33_005451 [Rhynchophorus ferrugineus]|uniref:Uncharacterized protein n=1 Tax=Rhynchophorus ferrugineus TaxID=354439 RepID=A0A834IK21_RHYFE|nr:hypothetical protein GWI33_005451 [Rhynchophorus ferrugineus]
MINGAFYNIHDERPWTRKNVRPHRRGRGGAGFGRRETWAVRTEAARDVSPPAHKTNPPSPRSPPKPLYAPERVKRSSIRTVPFYVSPFLPSSAGSDPIWI